MLSKKVPLYFSVLSIFIGAALVFIIFLSFSKTSKIKKSPIPKAIIDQSTSCDFNIVRLKGYRYVKPLLFTDKDCESALLNPLKVSIGNLVNKLKSSGDILSLSVYLRANGNWMNYNPDEKYNPGSLLKVPVLFTFLRMAEENPALLKKEIIFKGHDSKLLKHIDASKTLKQGQKYTMKELMRYMIVYSDNDATELLESQMTNKELEKTFSDVGLKEQIKDEKGTYVFTAKDYSVFLRVLYNSSYLNNENSEYATSLLAESDYKGALVKGLPDKTEIAHDVGESGNAKEHQLHDAGIIYINDVPYLITIMTKGPDLKKLSDAIGQISKLVYDNVTSIKN